MHRVHSSLPLSLGILCLLGFIIVATYVTMIGAFSFDAAILLWLNAQASPFLDTLFVAVTRLGGVLFVSVATLALAGAALFRRRYFTALFIALAVGGSALLHVLFKLLFERARPDLWEWVLVSETSYSFPSGHATASMALALSIVLLVWYTKWRVFAACVSAVYVLLVGLSRLYLGVHYPSDIFGGWLLAAATVLLLWSLLSRRIYKERA